MVTTIRTSPSGPEVDVLDPPLTTDDVENASGVAGDTASNALNTLSSTKATVPVTNADLAQMADGTTKGRALGAGSGIPTDLSGNQQVRNLRWPGTSVIGVTGGAVQTLTLSASVTQAFLNAVPSGVVIIDAIAHGSSSAGARIWIMRGINGTIPRILFRRNVASGVNMIETPGGRDWEADSSWGCVELLNDGTRWLIQAPALVPNNLEPIPSTPELGTLPFIVPITCPSGGAPGTLDDVTIWNASCPVNLTVFAAQLAISTAGPGASTAEIRSLAGGAGVNLFGTATIATSALGTFPLAPFTAPVNIAALASAFLRRDRSTVGTLLLHCWRR